MTPWLVQHEIKKQREYLKANLTLFKILKSYEPEEDDDVVLDKILHGLQETLAQTAMSLRAKKEGTDDNR